MNHGLGALHLHSFNGESLLMLNVLRTAGEDAGSRGDFQKLFTLLLFMQVAWCSSTCVLVHFYIFSTRTSRRPRMIGLQGSTVQRFHDEPSMARRFISRKNMGDNHPSSNSDGYETLVISEIVSFCGLCNCTFDSEYRLERM
jgi:hypothetical protein